MVWYETTKGGFVMPFHRYADNPISSAKDLPYPAHSVFNAAAVELEEDTLLLLRVEDRRGFSHLTVARSRDGFSNWRIADEPTLPPDPINHPEELWGIEDPRITRMEDGDDGDTFAIVYTAFSACGPLVSLATTRDFVDFKRWGPILPPEDKDAALFPVRFDGRYAMIHRPVPYMSNMGAHMWISFSPDLKHWGDHQILMSARSGSWWDANKIGLSPPPLRTDEGWLIMYHGVRGTASGSLYRVGLALLDLHDPTKVLRRSDEWVMGPQASYEWQGDVPGVVFPCGWVQRDGELRVYYGAADTTIAVATADMGEVMDWLHSHSEGEGKNYLRGN